MGKKRRKQLLTTDEAAQEIPLKKHTLENMRWLGIGPIFYKIGGRVFYHRADLRRYLQEARRRSSSGLRP